MRRRKSSELPHQLHQLISPRYARDNRNFSNLYDYDWEYDSVLFDMSGRIKERICKPNFTVIYLERQFWGMVRESFSSDTATGPAQHLLDFSSDLENVLRMAPPDAYDVLQDGYLLSIAPSYRYQKDLVAAARGGLCPSVNFESCSAEILLWTYIGEIINYVPHTVSPLILGITEEFRDLFLPQTELPLNKQEIPKPRLFSLLLSHPLNLALRCTEEVIGSLILAHAEGNKEAIRELQDLKFHQIVCGDRADCKHTLGKFHSLQPIQRRSAAADAGELADD